MPPHVLPFNFGSEVFNMGDVLSINCVVLKGDLPLEIQWTLNDELIETGQDGFTVMQLNSRTSYLSVDALEAKHRGVYSCIAQNLAGKAKFAAELQVNGWWHRGFKDLLAPGTAGFFINTFLVYSVLSSCSGVCAAYR